MASKPPTLDALPPLWNRRAVLKQLGLTPLLLHAWPAFGAEAFEAPAGGFAPANLSFSEPRLLPHYPSRSPLEDVLRRVRPGTDEFVTEGHAFEIQGELDRWAGSFRSARWADLKLTLHTSVQASSFTPHQETKLRQDTIRTSRREYSPSLQSSGPEQVIRALQAAYGVGKSIDRASFEITAIQEISQAPLTVAVAVRHDVLLVSSSEREQRVGTWAMTWSREGTAWTVRQWRAESETVSTVGGPGYVDVTQAAFSKAPSYEAQLRYGSDHWRSVLDGACGIDVYGNNGVAAGDFDGDGHDDLYVCQPAGLPNRLYRNRGDGTFEDVTGKAGVGVLDNTSCALFADFRNNGLQDLLVVCGGGPLLFLNQGDGSFRQKPDAFQFARTPEGTFTHAAIADYDRDGRLDIYFCLYSYYLGLDQYHYPVPYFDARNGPPNFLLHNEGDGRFVDRTEAAGLNVDNDRYSFACSWSESPTNNFPDLYVVNDFGRNVLYRSQGNGTFKAASTDSKVEDVGAGMSAAWTDINNDGKPDLYAADMWSAAGQRVSQQPQFQPGASDAIRSLYRKHAEGNALYEGTADGVFRNASLRANVSMGRWAWGSDFWDFDHDGYADLYVTNGYITAAESSGINDDLGSFFWRQVVGKSPNDSTPLLAYEHGWNALNELIRSDRSWSGSERNVMYANNRDGTFTEVSGVLGMDLLEDGRSFALADFDGDGRLEVVVKNRNAPQLRIVHNAMQDIGDSIVFRLRGTKSNRDGIGTSVTVETGGLRQTKYLQAGSGFLSQHSKELFFGLGRSPAAIRAVVRWPSGLTQHFENLRANHRIQLEEGSEAFTSVPVAAASAAYAHAGAPERVAAQETPSSDIQTWLLDPLKAPSFTVPDLSGKAVKLDQADGRISLVVFWATTSPGSLKLLTHLQQRHGGLLSSRIEVFAVNLDSPSDAAAARAAAQKLNLPFSVLLATEEVAGTYNILYRYLFDRRRDLPIPCSFLVDPTGMVVKLYQGDFTAEQVRADAQGIPPDAAARLKKALPFAGTPYLADFHRNDFTYGVAMFQHGYLEAAALYFQQVVTARPNDAEAYYNLGTLHLRRNEFVEARANLKTSLRLRPDYPEAWNNLGMMAAQEGRNEEAAQNFLQSLQLRPGYAIALLNLGNVYRRQGDAAKASDALNRALALQPDDPEANYGLGMLAAQQNRVSVAEGYLRKAIALRADYPEALNNLGVLLVRKQDYDGAAQQFQTCIRLVPTFEQSYFNLARVSLLQHDKAKARSVLEDLLRLRPDSAAGRQALQTLDAAP
ncbi:TPR repeat-containing protein [Terriglobus roseus DSM 18391]|uniref:TPR repeat-containing protein n=1 Tax=Terriglobus roseus (strain DSM 18391 / NRRL B-41598 / KBS 63) TaxID=926566 RepID=I3ZIS5_TERRK|nr:FG-GAP-like repeat-containing protein [Terriglobus roseus]AFL89143.1 TPR repeat-containing protein [Terriglobus roseus DSM 18391]